MGLRAVAEDVVEGDTHVDTRLANWFHDHASQRPFFSDPLASESSYSFPSGHASVSLAVYGTIAFIAARRLSNVQARLAVLVAAAILVLLICISRLYLGVHFLTDVIAGFSLGLAWVTLCVLLLHLGVRLGGGDQTSRYQASR